MTHEPLRSRMVLSLGAAIVGCFVRLRLPSEMSEAVIIVLKPSYLENHVNIALPFYFEKCQYYSVI